MSEDLGITTGGDTLSHVLSLGTNSGGAFTPDGIAAATEKLAAAMRQISKEDFEAAGTDGFDDTPIFADWSQFTVDFLAWKAAHSSWISDAWNQTRDDLVDFVSRYNALRARWVAIYPATTAPNFTVQDAPGNTLENLGKQVGAALQHIALGAGILAGVGVGAWIIWRIAR